LHALVSGAWDALADGRHGDESALYGVSTADVVAFASEIGDEITGLGAVKPTIAVRVSANWASVVALVCTLAKGCNPLVVSKDTPVAEVDRLLRAANGSVVLDPMREHGKPFIEVSGEARKCANGSEEKPGLFIPTSGSTGAPKLIFRDMDTWQWETDRYQALLEPSNSDHILLCSPLSHAYSLGWLWMALLGGRRLELVEPNALGLAITAITQRADMVALTPAIAKLLAKRRHIKNTSPGPGKLKIVMAGAGAVSATLDQNFYDSFGVRLSRNYGSTETGAVIAGLAPQTGGFIGPSMPNVSCQLMDDKGQTLKAGPGRLAVTLENGASFHMGDVAEISHDGCFSVLGRVSNSIRRGERWVSPIEVANVIRESGLVTDVHVRGVNSNNHSDQKMLASVVNDDGQPVDMPQLMDYCARNLAPHKRPDIWEQANSMARGPTGKIPAKPRYRVGDPEVLAAAARAYKVSSLLFSLVDSGLLQAMEQPRTTDELAVCCGLKPDAVEQCLAVAKLCGLVAPVDDLIGEDTKAPTTLSHDAFVKLERLLFDGLASPTALTEVLKVGLTERSFEKQPPLNEALRQAYGDAMQGSHKVFGRTLALRKLSKAKPRMIMEAGASSGAYISSILRRDEDARGVFVRIGHLCPPLNDELREFKKNERLQCIDFSGPSDSPLGEQLAGQLFDAIIVDNGVHGPSPAGDVDWLVEHLSPSGSILIDDIFLSDGANASIGVDWLTHGGVGYLEPDTLVRHFETQGLNVTQILPANLGGIHNIFLATREKIL